MKTALCQDLHDDPLAPHDRYRLIDIVASSVTGDGALTPGELAAIKRRAFHAILDEEEGRLPKVEALIAEIRAEVDRA